MTAEDTALRVIRWAATRMTEAIPSGDLAVAVRLAEPDPELLHAAGRLAAITAARLRLTWPVLADTRPPGPGAALLAAAIGGHARREQVELLLTAVPAAVTTADLLARHGLAEPAISLLPALSDQIRDLSPLTGVLDRPGPRTESACEDLLDTLREDPSSRQMLIPRFAAPADSPEQARWRGACLSQLRHADREFVLDVYETALTYYASEHERLTTRAWQDVVLAGPNPRSRAISPRTRATAYWWRALAELTAADPGRVRESRVLPKGRAGTSLYWHVLRREPG